MAYIRRRKLASGNVRWQVIWDVEEIAPGGGPNSQARQRDSAMFDSQREAKEKLAAILNSRPKRTGQFRVLTDNFLAHYEKLVEKGERERSTIRQLKQHINLHILPDSSFAVLKCSDIGTPEVQLFLDRLIDRVSPAMSSKIRNTLSRVFSHGARRGFVSSNPVQYTQIERRVRPDAGEPEHFELPAKEDLKALLAAAKLFDNTGRATAVVRLLMFCGLRISEVRGLWHQACPSTGPTPQVRVVQRADRFDAIGPVKGAASRRTIDLGEETARAIAAWQTNNQVDSLLLFPNDEGNVWSYGNFWHRFWVPLMNAAKLVTDEPASRTVREWSEAQADFWQPRFGPHTLRHVYASLQIEQGVSPKRLQKLMGHATLKLTLDTYGHLWPDESADKTRARDVEKALGA